MVYLGNSATAYEEHGNVTEGDTMYGWRAQIGFIVPSNNTVIEPELYNAVPEGVSYHFTKVSFSGPRDGRNMDTGEGVEVLKRGGMDVIVYACMATSFVDAGLWEKETTEKTGIPTFTATSAVKEALRAVDAHTVSLVCHYPKDRFDMVRKSFKEDGFDVVSIESAEESDQKNVNRISTEEIYRLARKADTKDADAVCLLATDLRSFPILEALEEDLGKPVISTNQAILWKALNFAGIPSEVPGYGLLLSGEIPEPAAAD